MRLFLLNLAGPLVLGTGLLGQPAKPVPRIPVSLAQFPQLYGDHSVLQIREFVARKDLAVEGAGESKFYGTIVRLYRGEELLRTFNSGGAALTVETATDYSGIWIIPLLSATSGELVIVQYSGGANCCWISWVYDLTEDSPRLLFQSQDYSSVYGLNLSDWDGDGVYEIEQFVGAFRYFRPCSNASSPVPRVVFKYFFEDGRYRPANYLFQEYLLSRIDNLEWDLNVLWNSQELDSDEFGCQVLRVVLGYLYTARAEEGWSFFEMWFRGTEGAALRHRIEAILATEPVYAELQRPR